MKKLSIGKKITVILGSLGIIIFIMCMLNVSALKTISEYNSTIGQRFAEYKDAYESGDTQAISKVEENITYTMQHSNTKISGTYVFDVAIVVISVTIIIVMCIILNKIIAKPIQKVNDKIKFITDGDLTVRFDEEYTEGLKDEIIQMQSTMNNMTYRLSNIIGNVIGVSNAVDNSMNELTDMAKSISMASEDVAKAIDEISVGAVSTSEDTEHIVEMVASIGDSIENIKNNTDKLIETANDMNNTKDIVVGTLNELENVNRNIGLDIDGVNKQIEITSACIRNIQSAIDNIKAITKQTNLLSLNARIEASRVSREIGRGFAVVAEEISSLADESAKSSNEIDNSLNELLTNYSLIVEKMTKTTSNINNQNSKLSDTKIAFETLDDDIKGTINKINDINTMVETLNDDRKQILDKTYNLSAIVQESSASCEEVNASCEEFIATVQTMCNNINEVKNKSESLNNSVKVFKI